MRWFTFFDPVLNALTDGKVIRKTIAWILQILGVLAALAGLLAVIQVLKFSFQTHSAEATIGGLFLAMVFSVAVACVAQILFARAKSVKGLGDSPFTVIPIVSLMLRAIGEMYATLGLAIGIGGCVFLWLARANPLGLLGGFDSFMPSLPSEGTFLGGLVFCVLMAFVSFVVLLVFYFSAEAMVVVVDIAKNTRSLATAGIPPLPGGREPGFKAAPSGPRCARCSSILEPGSRFCQECGASAQGTDTL